MDIKYENSDYELEDCHIIKSNIDYCYGRACSDEFPELFENDIKNFKKKIYMKLSDKELEIWKNGILEYMEIIHPSVLFKIEIIDDISKINKLSDVKKIFKLGENDIRKYWCIWKLGKYYMIELF